MAKSPLAESFKSFEDKKPYTFSSEEVEQYNRILERIIKARNQREQPRDEFDGMTYEQAYLSNKRAAMSYLTPKKNDDEVRINTGTTEKRIELVMNELLALNLTGEVRAFDKDDILYEDVSDIFTDIVKRTEQIEKAKDKDLYVFYELLTQPSVFVEELWIEEKQRSSAKGFQTRKRCERRLIQGIQMYLGDVSIPDIRFNDQPYLVKYARMSYSEAESIFGDYDNFNDCVKPGAYITVGSPGNTLYRKGGLSGEEVEAFWYMSYPDNELQIIVNGIPMLKVGAKYTDEYGELGGYHLTMVSLKPLSGDWSYGKPLTQSAKTLQALDNETIRNLIRKFRQALEPPLGVPKGKVYSRDIWNPGAMAQGVKAGDFEKLIDHQGVTQSELAMFDLIEKKTNEFIGTSQTEPLQGKTSVTATELMLAQKNAIKMLGNSVLAVMRLKERLTLLRVKNALLNYTKPVGKQFDPLEQKIREVYARFSLDGADIEGQKGTRVIQMADRGMTEEEQLSTYAAEQRAKEAGQPFEYKMVNIPALKQLDLYFYVTVSAREQESSQLDKAMFSEMLNQAAGVSRLIGRPVSADKITQKFERTWHEKDIFEKAPPPMPQGMPGQEAASLGGSQVGETMRKMPTGGLMGQMPELGGMR